MPNFFSEYVGYLRRFHPLRADQRTDPVVLEKIRNGDKSALEMVYKAHRLEFIRWLTREYQCTEEDARDVYQVSILTMYDNIKQEKLNNLNSSLKTYLFAIGKYKILEKKKEEIRHFRKLEKELEDQPMPDAGKWDDELYEESLDLVEKCMEKLGDPCRSLLELYYYHGMSMEEISEKMNYKNRFTSKNLKYKCINRLRKIYLEEYRQTQKIV